MPSMRAMRKAQRFPFVRSVVCAASLLLSSTAQVDWYRLDALPPRSQAAFAADPLAPGLIRFGGADAVGSTDETWRWDGAGWRSLRLDPRPSRRQAAAMAFDPLRGRSILFGGLGYGPSGILSQLADTWSFDGHTWTRLSPIHAPPPRQGARMAWHGPSGKLVLVGGTNFNGAYGDTWEWDGTDWAQRSVPPTLPTLTDFTLAADERRGRLVLHGGNLRAPVPDFGTFEWDGNAWTRLQPTTPLPFVGGGMAYDPQRQRVVLHVARGWQTIVEETWAFDGATWSLLNLASTPGSSSTDLVLDPASGGVAMLVGQTTPQPGATVWLLDATGWRALRQSIWPRASFHVAAAFDAASERVLVYDGRSVSGHRSTTLEFSRAGWHVLAPLNSPPGRTSFAMVGDGRRARLVLFGGADSIFVTYDDTWAFDGLDWVDLAPANRPPASFGHAMAFDAHRDRIVLFGGQSLASPGTAPTQTYEFDGSDWLLRQPANVPPGRFGAAMAYDPIRRETLLFGGSLSTSGVAQDTWVWDGTDWTPRTSPTNPAPRFGAAMSFDEARGVIVLVGGRAAPLAEPHDEVWEWDGLRWTERVPASLALARSGAALCFAPWLDGSLCIGGQEWLGNPEDAGAVYRPVDPARARRYGTPCVGTQGPLVLSAEPGERPFLGRSFLIQSAPLRAGQLAWLNFGVSARQAGQVLLPFDLGPFGMPGCALLASNEAAAFAVASSPAWRLSLVVPPLPSLLGLELFLQAMATDPGANQLGLVTSNGLELRVGRW